MSKLRRALIMSSVRSPSLVLSCLLVLVLCGWTAGKSCQKSCQSPLVLYSVNCVCVPSFVQCFKLDEKGCAAVVKAKFCNTPTYMVSCARSCGLCKSDYVPSSKLAIAFFPGGKSALGIYQGSCGSAPRLTNGACTATHGKLSDIATCVCNTGYAISGHGLSQCQSDGTWSAHATTCVVENCGSPPVVARASVIAPVTTFGATATYTCNVGFRLRGPHISICRSDGTWSPMGRICTHFVYKNNRVLVFRIAPGNGVSTVSTWENNAISHDSPLLSTSIQPGCFVQDRSKACTTHFKSSIVNDWEKSGILEVLVLLSRRGKTYYFKFDGRGTNRMNWFSKAKLISSSWPRITKQRFNKFGIKMYSYRRWYINRSWGGCSSDYGWMLVKDTSSYGGCGYEKYRRFPVVRFSSSDRSYGNARYYRQADSMGIYVKLASDVCGSPPTLQGATVSYSSIAVGAKATYTCLKYWAAKNSPLITCQADGTWSSLSYTCTLFDCGKPKAISNAVVNAPLTTVGQTATYTCTPGYNASGTPTILCKAGGTWASTDYKCSITNCGAPPTVVDATVSAPSNLFGATATYKCNQGFTWRSGSLTITCLSNQKWSTPNLKCSQFAYINGYVLGMRIIPGNGVNSAKTWINKSIELDFPIPKSLQPGCVTFDTSLPCNTHFRSTLVNYWSKIGLTRVRVNILKNKSAVRILDFNPRGTTYINWFSRKRLTRSTWKNLPLYYKSSMNYFTIDGPSDYRNWYINRRWGGCRKDSGWLVVKDTAAGYCSYDKGSSFPRIRYSNSVYNERATGYATADTMLILLKLASDVCGPPPAVANAKVAFSSLAVGTDATYTCNPGYTPSGKATARCLSDSKREAPALKCTIKDCGTPPAVLYASVVATTTTYGSTATYTCNKGFLYRSGSTTISCQTNGKWSTSALKCSYFVYMRNWILAMRIVSGNKISSRSTWYNAKKVYDAPISSKLPAGCLTGNASLPCTTHFRSFLVNNWRKIGLQKVAVHVMKAGRLVKKLEFKGAGTSITNWFSRRNLLSSSWRDLTSRTYTNYFRIFGSHSFRRWYINRNFGGCNVDRGWLVVKDSRYGVCPYDKGSSYPRIQYSDISIRKLSKNYATADTMLILLKLAKDVCGPPPSVRRSTVKYSSLSVGSKATYTCRAGFQATSSPSIQCLSDSTWSKVAFSCEPNSCANVRKCKGNTNRDGEYWIHPTLLQGKKIKVFCYKMLTRSPLEYITLKRHNYANYPNIRNKDCKGKDVPLPKKYNRSGRTTYKKVRLHIQTMKVIRSDLTFATSTTAYRLNFGTAYSCYSKLKKCNRKGVSVVDFRGTGITIKSTPVYSTGAYGGGRYSYTSSREYYRLVCGGYCGGCYMGGNIRMKWRYNPSSRGVIKVTC
ncbi:sushi, von Willebrand factor type A, EGF and pentraxin domain-containing protein 1-like [Haliotis asinina]|uniref:sushi, von Willebrand factor type A, EGF and pentraxin domain-containing protein 1-like n=1 Tax=Haliotis asinina TaxID=109174 RepID=UPI00353193EC